MDLIWTGRMEGTDEVFPASVPGNIQADYAAAHGWGDLHYADNCQRYLEIEDAAWLYETSFYWEKKNEERLFFVTEGIDYEYDILLNGRALCHHEGLYSPVEIDLTADAADGENLLAVRIYPHPKRADAPVSRTQADRCVKPPVGYGWDWHPRVIASGLWNDTGIEIRTRDFISRPSVTCDLSEDLRKGTLSLDFRCDADYILRLFAPDGALVSEGTERTITVTDPLLWWCNGQGEANLYTWEIVTATCKRSGKVGFRRVELVMGSEHWREPHGFPKSRSFPPITIRLNGRSIFAKGSNFVSPEIFQGQSNEETYLPLVRLAKDANMNIFRMWGGSGIQKDRFYELCDECGIMVWQEFPLVCNNYVNDPHYLEILEQEATCIVKSLRKHPCVVLWCGGNELFNGWSKMTDQHHALRLLNKICYDHDRNTPFLATSPLAGMAHGCYLFSYEGKEVYRMFNEAHYTAYTEFGVPSVAPTYYLKSFIPENQLFPPRRESTWKTHHAFDSWCTWDTWICIDTLEKYFGKMTSLEDIVKYSNWLQCEGYKAIFEEARRQKPYCSMAINWCYNEPWKTAANNALLCYPALPKPAYYAVKNSLQNAVPSARLKKFSYKSGEVFSAELWLLNDGSTSIENEEITATVQIGGRVTEVLKWRIDSCNANENLQGHVVQFVLPKIKGVESFRLTLTSKSHGTNSYDLHYEYKANAPIPEIPVLNL